LRGTTQWLPISKQTKTNSPEPDSENKDISLFVNAPSEHDSIHKNFDKMLKCMQALMVCEW